MRKIITTTFLTLDGVMQAPGGPKEDTENNFKHGGWQMNYNDQITGEVINAWMKQPFELLLGRKTYDIWAGFWPHATQPANIAKPFNTTKKYVVTHKPTNLSWQNSTNITGDVIRQIKQLKEENGPDLWVWGSANLIQTLLKHHLVDRMHIWIFPLTLGTGKKLFAEGTMSEDFKLIDSKISTTGVIFATYEREIRS